MTVTKTISDVIVDYAVFILVSTRNTRFRSLLGINIEDEEEEWDGSLRTVDDLMRAGFVMPLPRNKITSIDVRMGLSEQHSSATISMLNPYAELGLWGTEFAEKLEKDPTKKRKLRPALMSREPRKKLIPGGVTQEEEAPFVKAVFQDHGDYVSLFLENLVRNTEEWRELVKRREDLKISGVKEELLRTLGPLGKPFSGGVSDEYVKDYVGYKYVFTIEDMTPIWICARVREDLESEVIGDYRKKLAMRYPSKLGGTLGEWLGFDRDEEERKREPWVFLFHGFVSSITEGFTPRTPTLSLVCKSFTDYISNTSLRSHYSVMQWLTKAASTLRLQDILSTFNPGDWQVFLNNWWNNKTPRSVLANIVFLCDSSFTYLGRKKFKEHFAEEGQEGGSSLALKADNFFHYDHFWLPYEKGVGVSETDTTDVEGEAQIENTRIVGAQVVKDKDAALCKEEDYCMVGEYDGSLEWITTGDALKVPSLAEDVHWLLSKNHSFEDLALRWWGGVGIEDPDSNLDPSFSMRNRWKPRVALDPMMLHHSVFVQSFMSGFSISDIGQLISGHELLHRLCSYMDAFYFTDGKGNLVFINSRWDDLPRLKGELEKGWSMFNNVWTVLHGNPTFNDKGLMEIGEETDFVFKDFDKRYIITDNERSFKFSFNEAVIKTVVMTQGRIDYIPLGTDLQLLINTSTDVLDRDSSEYLQNKYGIRLIEGTIENPSGMFDGLFIGGSGGIDLIPSQIFVKAFNQSLLRKIFAKSQDGSVSLGYRVDLQLGRSLLHAERQKIGWITGITHNLQVGGTAETSVSLSFVRDIGDIIGNPLWEAILEAKTKDENIVKYAVAIPPPPKVEEVRVPDGTMKRVIPNAKHYTPELFNLVGAIPVPHLAFVPGTTSMEQQGTFELYMALKDAMKILEKNVEDGLRQFNIPPEELDPNWKIYAVSAYRKYGTSVERDPGGLIDSTDANGHWTGRAIDFAISYSEASGRYIFSDKYSDSLVANLRKIQRQYYGFMKEEVFNDYIENMIRSSLEEAGLEVIEEELGSNGVKIRNHYYIVGEEEY